MDEYPAGPASADLWRQSLTVVIPVHNGGRDFERCLQGLRVSTCNDFECVVVDDGSTDDSGAKAAEFGAVVIRHDRPLGPAAARNAGALAATRPLLFFLDADVAVHPNAIARALQRFAVDDQLTGLFGSYDDQPAVGGWVSPFRNLLHHYVHQTGTFHDDIRPARTFWTGCGFIQREAFLSLGGFDPLRFRRPAIEDIELGYRIARGGHKLVLARDVQASHLKRWTLKDMVRTDIFQRGVPWMLLMKRSAVTERDLNVSRSQQLSVAATGLGGLGLLAAFIWPILGLITLASLAAVVGLNAGFYRFLSRTRGALFAVAAIPLHLIYFTCCGVSVLIALGIWHLAPRHRLGELDGTYRLRLDPGAVVDQPSTPGPHHDLAPNRASTLARTSGES